MFPNELLIFLIFLKHAAVLLAHGESAISTLLSTAERNEEAEFYCFTLAEFEVLDQSGKLSSWSKNVAITFELKYSGEILGYVRYSDCGKTSKKSDSCMHTSSSTETDESTTDEENESSSNETMRERRSDEPANREIFVSINERLHKDKENIYPHNQLILQFSVFKFLSSFRLGSHRVVITLTSKATYTLIFDDACRDEFVKFFSEILHNKLLTFMFKRMEEIGQFRRQPSVRNFLQQQNLWKNSPTMDRYAKAILENGATFRNKIVLDVIVGLPILSIAAVHAGASQVYAVSRNFIMAKEAQTLINDNLDQIDRRKIEIIVGSIEYVQLRQKVDIVLTEPVGIAQYLQQLRKINKPAYGKWLKEDGIIFPTSTYFYATPFQDDQCDEKLIKQLTFWHRDINTLRMKSMVEYVITDTFEQEIASELGNLIADPCKIRVNNIDNLTNGGSKRVEFPIKFKINSGARIHGLVFWVDASFGNDPRLTEQGRNNKLHLSRITFRKPLPVPNNRVIEGKLMLELNADQETSTSHHVTMTIDFVNLNEAYQVDLKNFPY